MLALLLGVWVSGRAILWENPFPLDAAGLPSLDTFLAQADANAEGPIEDQTLAEKALPRSQSPAHTGQPILLATAFSRSWGGNSELITSTPAKHSEGALTPVVAAGHIFLMSAAFQIDWEDGVAFRPVSSDGAGVVSEPYPFPQSADRLSLGSPAADRWSLDAFAFYRAGSNSTAISQGRVPVYGASQAAARLQYALAPESRHTPRAYLRGYRAFAAVPEDEVAIGASARPLPNVPARVFTEVRVTDSAFGTDIRPAAFAVTELPVQSLPLDTKLEVYAGAGYVGGEADTPFVDGQVAITREVIKYTGSQDQDVQLSFGAGAWGGAQNDASRLDVGPTFRVDLSVGEVPARISFDWRERVAGDAAPTSGVAATLSTRF